jgi:hypothetical protein
LSGVGAKHSDKKFRVSAIDYARMLRPYRDLMGRLSELYHRDNRLRLLFGVGAKHSDKKSRVSAIDYARMLRPYRDLMGRLSELYHRDDRLRLLVYCPG